LKSAKYPVRDEAPTLKQGGWGGDNVLPQWGYLTPQGQWQMSTK